jgi:hypothetical protein
MIKEEMAKVTNANEYLADKDARSGMIRRNVLHSSVFEGIYHVTALDLAKPVPTPAKEPRRKSG